MEIFDEYDYSTVPQIFSTDRAENTPDFQANKSGVKFSITLSLLF